jgi:hypothetical protein
MQAWHQPPRRRYDVGMARRFQFSIRVVLGMTAAIGTAIGAVVAEPSWQSLIALEGVSLFFSAFAVIAALRTKRSVQAFWIGNSIAFCAATILATSDLPSFLLRVYLLNGKLEQADLHFAAAAQCVQFMLAAFWCAAPANGLLAAVAHRLFFDDY